MLALNSGFGWWRPSPGLRQITGYVLLGFGVAMWLLSLRRSTASGTWPGYRRWHETGGLAMLPVLLLHAARPRTTLLVLLTSLVLALSTLGALHPNFATPRSEGYLKAWWSAHIFLACVASALMLVHLWAIVAY